MKAAWDVKTSARGKLLVKVVVSSVENYNSGKSNLKVKITSLSNVLVLKLNYLFAAGK